MFQLEESGGEFVHGYKFIPTSDFPSFSNSTSDKEHLKMSVKAKVEKQPDVKKEPDMKEPEMKEPDMKEPDMKEPDMKEPDMKEPKVKKEPEVKGPEAKKKKKKKSPRMSPFWLYALRECSWTGLHGEELAEYAGSPGNWPDMGPEERLVFVEEARLLNNQRRASKMSVKAMRPG